MSTAESRIPPAPFARYYEMLQGKEVAISESDPVPGFYRIRKHKEAPWELVAIQYYGETGEEELKARRGGADGVFVEMSEVWPWCAKHPVDYLIWIDVANGEPWPDEHEAVTLSNNAPADDSLEAISDQIENLAREAAKLATAGEAKDQAEADRAADLKNKIDELRKAADAKRIEEKRPHDAAGQAVQDKWKPWIDKADAAKTNLGNKVLGPYFAKIDAENVRRRQEAARTGAAPTELKVTAGSRGRTVHATKRKTAKIIDRAKVLEHFAGHDRLSELLQELANASVRSGLCPPGCEVINATSAA